MILGLIFSPLALAEFTFAQELGKPEDVGKPEDISKKEQQQADKEARLTEKLADREARLAEKLAQVQQKLLEKASQLGKREQALLGKLNEGSYHGPILGGDPVTNQYIVSFNALDATTRNPGHSETFAGDITLENVVTRGNNLKLKVTGCSLIGDLVTYDCAFGKARAISAGQPDEKNSLIIIAFLEDESGNHNTLKMFVDTGKPLRELGSGPVSVDIKKSQSGIGHDWFIGGDATITVTGSTENPNFTGIIKSELTDEEEAAKEAAGVEEPEVEVAEVEVEVVEVEVEELEVEPTEPTEPTEPET